MVPSHSDLSSTVTSFVTILSRLAAPVEIDRKYYLSCKYKRLANTYNTYSYFLVSAHIYTGEIRNKLIVIYGGIRWTGTRMEKFSLYI